MADGTDTKFILVNVLSKQRSLKAIPETVSISFDKYSKLNTAVSIMKSRANEFAKMCNSTKRTTSTADTKNVSNTPKIKKLPNSKYTRIAMVEGQHILRVVSRGWPRKANTFCIFAVDACPNDPDIELFNGIKDMLQVFSEMQNEERSK